jgi:hypothetical protein
MAALMCAVAVYKGAGGTAILIGVLSVAAFLSEISFGERALDFEAPEVQGVKIDAVHDVLHLSWVVVSHGKLYFILILIFAALAAGLLVYLIKTSKRFRAFATHSTMPLITASLTLIMAGQIMD